MSDYNSQSLAQLKTTAKSLGIVGYSKYTAATKTELIALIEAALPKSEPDVQVLRELTPEEIDDILQGITTNPGIPQVVAESHVAKIRCRVKSQLQRVKMYPTAIPMLKEEIVKQYNSAKIQPGESVGIVTAQSIGERQTQMTLDTFHSAGAALKTVIAGVPRFSELMSATHNPKVVTSTVFPLKAYESVSELRMDIGCMLQTLTLGDLLTDTTIDEDSELPQWYCAYEAMYGAEYKKHANYLTLMFDVEKLFMHKIDLEKIAEKIEGQYDDLVCVFSPTMLGRIDVYVDTVNVGESNAREYMLNVVSTQLMSLVVSGVSGITEVYYEKKSTEWVIETRGTNLLKLLNNPLVDATRTVSNEMWEIVSVLGIEAAREFLIGEFGECISSDGTYINKCHTQLLVDVMTHGGSIMSVSRYGHGKSKCGPLAKASFEKSLDNFLKAGVTSEVERTTSVSGSIMLGKIASCGTGVFDIHVDIPKIMASGTSEFDSARTYEF